MYNRDKVGQEINPQPTAFPEAKSLFLGCNNWADSANMNVSEAAIFLWHMRDLETILLSGGVVLRMYLRQTTTAAPKATPPPALDTFQFVEMKHMPRPEYGIHKTF